MNGDRLPGRPLRRAVSPVIGVILLVAIVVVLAAVLSTMVLGMQDQLREPVPPGGFDYDYVATGEDNTDDRPYLIITNEVGEPIDSDKIFIKDGSGNAIAWGDVWTGGPEVKAGEDVHIDGFGSDSALDPICEEGQTYRVVLERDEGVSAIIYDWTVPGPPDLPAGSPSDGDGDGIPDWC